MGFDSQTGQIGSVANGSPPLRVAQALSYEDGTANRYTLRRNTANIMNFDFDLRYLLPMQRCWTAHIVVCTKTTQESFRGRSPDRTPLHLTLLVERTT